MRIPKPWYREQNKTWYVCIRGKQIKLGKNETLARKKYHKLMQHGTVRTDYTVRQLLKAYWKYIKRKLAAETVSRRKPVLVSFNKHVPASLKADELRAYHVQEWIEANSKIKVAVTKKRKKVRTKTTNKQISPTTEGDRIGLIKGVMSWAKAMGYIETNPIEDMPKPEPRVRQEFIPADLWQRVLDLATDQAFRDFLTVMLSAGTRPQEMFKFSAEHFDVAGKRLILEIENSKGKRKSRVVQLPSDALEVVTRLAAQYPTGKLFRNRKGNGWTKNAIRCRFRYLKEKLGMPNLCATTLRHSYAHYRLSQGQDALTVAKLMGHVDTRMVSTRYGHLDGNSDYMQNAANQIPLPITPLPLPIATTQGQPG